VCTHFTAERTETHSHVEFVRRRDKLLQISETIEASLRGVLFHLELASISDLRFVQAVNETLLVRANSIGTVKA
jgi:hypothetical protein